MERDLLAAVLGAEDDRSHLAAIDRRRAIAGVVLVEDGPDARRGRQRIVLVAAVLRAQRQHLQQVRGEDRCVSGAPVVLAIGAVDQRRVEVGVDRRDPPSIVRVGERMDLDAHLGHVERRDSQARAEQHIRQLVRAESLEEGPGGLRPAWTAGVEVHGSVDH